MSNATRLPRHIRQVLFAGVATTATLAATPAAATNLGANFNLTTSPATGAMAGAGYVRPRDVYASVFGNPATMAQESGDTSFQVGAAYMHVQPGARHDGSIVPAFEQKSEFNQYVLPQVAVRQRVNDRLVLGGGIGVISGLGSDFRNAPLSPQVTYMLFGANLGAAYEVTDRLTLGLTGQMTYGLLEFGLASDTGLKEQVGFRGLIGATYDLGPVMLGASYASKLDQTFNDVTATDLGPGAQPVFSDVTLDQPQEFHFGIATTDSFSSTLSLEVDVIQLEYGSAQGFRDIWQDQTTLAMGAEYDTGHGWRLRTGFALHSELRKKDVSGATSLGSLESILAPVGPGGAPAPLPVSPPVVQLVQATITQPYWQKQISAGVGIDLTDTITADFGANYAFDGNTSFGGTELFNIEEVHIQFGISWTF
ncbi:OmpP1/FadL family transporter [Yunchengibacter salinarum]|uniref:OmpP1/FadL family transporter n=1 Tax=Yunchengibacter salinarum TaxID=3133399 RepID=UPI0035B5D34B